MHMQETCAQPIKDIITGKIRMQEMWAVLIVQSISISICILFHPISTFEQLPLDTDLFSPMIPCGQFTRRQSSCRLQHGQAPQIVSAPMCAGLGGSTRLHNGALRVQNAEGNHENYGTGSLFQSHVGTSHRPLSLYSRCTVRNSTRNSCRSGI